MKRLILIAVASFFIGCSDDNKSSAQPQALQESSAVAKVEQRVKEVAKAQEVVAKADKVEIKEEVSSVVKTGESIYRACAGCHGQKAEKAALGKSQIIKGWDSKKTADALNGYKAGTYGGTMKGVMKGQASGLSDEDVKLVSEYISKL